MQIATRNALALPSILAALMIAIAGAIALRTGVDGSAAFLPYVSAWAATTFLATLIWLFVEIARLACRRAERPLQIATSRLRDFVPILLLPAVIFPLFLGGYTWAKCSIPFIAGYPWEATWADADHLLFGMDAWRWAHALIPSSLALAWTFFYAAIWGFALLFSGVAISFVASRRFTATFFTALMLSWLVGGIATAYAISAAGPVFAHLADPHLADRFLPLREELARILPQDDYVLRSQRYLVVAMENRVAVKGAGISAMPSMHIATATILLLAAWRTWWFAPAALFACLTFIGSIYVGYHYAVDAPIAAMIAAICWIAARAIYRLPSEEIHRPSPGLGLNPVSQRAGR